MKSALERIEETSRTLQGVVGGIDFIVDRPALSDREKVEKIKAVLRAYHERTMRPLCASCGTVVNACDEAVDAEGRPVHRDCAL